MIIKSDLQTRILNRSIYRHAVSWTSGFPLGMLFNNISAKRCPLSAVISLQFSHASFYGKKRRKKEEKKERSSLRWQLRGETNAATTIPAILSRWRRRDWRKGI